MYKRQLLYDFTKLINVPFIRGVSANVFVNNVTYIVKHTDNIDPESQYSASDLSAGIEFHGLPPTRSYGVAVNIKF